MIFLSGDIHGEMGINKLSHDRFPEGHSIMSKKDYVIILGDFGLLFHNNNTEKYWLDWLDSKPWTTLFVDGNHENFNMINVLPEIPMFDGIVGKVNDSVYHLKRGQIYNIDDNKLFTFGGAASIDKASRVVDISWWPEEMPNYAEMSFGLENLEKNDNKVDYILTHTCPQKIANMIKYKIFEEQQDSTREFLDEVANKVKFKKWYFGHWHMNKNFEDNYISLYEDIILLGEIVVENPNEEYNKI